MTCYITTTCIGYILTDKNNDIIKTRPFDNAFLQLSKEGIDDSLKEFIESVPDEFENIVIETNLNKNAFENLCNFKKITTEKTTTSGRFLRENLESISYEYFDIDLLEYQHDLYSKITEDKINQSTKINDVMIIESINTLEELEDTTGKLIEQLRQWTNPYVPELSKIHNHRLYAKIIKETPRREDIKNLELLKDSNITFSDTLNINMDDEDLEIIQDFASSVVKLYDTKKLQEEYIQQKVSKIAPNLNNITGSNLAAKLIAHCHGLEPLAKLPSSTIQIIGAEKAIFRHLKTGENPPKHGLIYQHPQIRGSNWWVRGKIARVLAATIAKATRMDAYTSNIYPELKDELDQKIEKINKDNPIQPRRKNKTIKKDKVNKSKKKKKNRKKKLKKGEYYY